MSAKQQILNDIARKIDLWHTGTSELFLHDYLGMSWEEYELYVRDQSKWYEKYRRAGSSTGER